MDQAIPDTLPDIQQMPPKPQPQGNHTDCLKKSVAAREVYKQLKLIKMGGMISIGGMFAVSLISIFSKMGGAIGAAIISAPLVWFMYKAVNEMRRLEYNYRIDPRTGQ